METEIVIETIIDTKFNAGERVWAIGKSQTDPGKWEPISRGTIGTIYAITEKNHKITYSFQEEPHVYHAEDVLYRNSEAAYDECDKRNGVVDELEILLKECKGE